MNLLFAKKDLQQDPQRNPQGNPQRDPQRNPQQRNQQIAPITLPDLLSCCLFYCSCRLSLLLQGSDLIISLKEYCSVSRFHIALLSLGAQSLIITKMIIVHY